MERISSRVIIKFSFYAKVESIVTRYNMHFFGGLRFGRPIPIFIPNDVFFWIRAFRFFGIVGMEGQVIAPLDGFDVHFLGLDAVLYHGHGGNDARKYPYALGL